MCSCHIVLLNVTKIFHFLYISKYIQCVYLDTCTENIIILLQNFNKEVQSTIIEATLAERDARKLHLETLRS